MLGSLRRMLRSFAASRGLVAAGWIVVIAVAASFLVDWSLVLPAAVRLILLVAGAFILGRTLVRRVIEPLSRRIPDTELAKLIETSHPELRQSLITAVELGRKGSEAAALVSPAMLASVIRGVEADVERVDPGRVIDRTALRRSSLLLGGAALVLAAVAVDRSDLASIWFRRNVLLAGDRWPKQVQLELVSPRLPIVAAVGDPVEIIVRALRGYPSSVVISSWDEGKTAVRADSLAETTSNTYRKVFEDVARPFSFRIRGGDDEIGPFDVAVRLRPRIDMQSIRIWCDYPTYTGIPPTPAEQPLRHGNLKVPSGTRVRFAMAANVPILDAHFVFVPAAGADAEPASRPGSPYAGEEPAAGAAPEGEVWPDPGAVKLALADSQSFSGEFTVTGGGQYYFQMEAADGFRSRRPERFRVEAIPDRKPIVRILEPQRLTEEVSPDARVRVRVSASDDYGSEKGVIEGLYFAPGSDAGRSQSFPLPALSAAARPPQDGAPAVDADRERGDRSRSVEDSIVLDVAKLDTGGAPPAPGARFQFLAIASDLGGNLGESQVHQIQIVDKDDLLKILTDQLMLVRDQLRDAGRRQKSARKDLEDFQKELGLRAMSGPESQKLFRHRQNQERVSQALERELAEIERILARTDANKLGDEKWTAWVGGVRDDVHALARRKSPEIEKGLDAVRSSASQGGRDAASLSPLAGAQKELERELHDIDLRLTEFGDMNALVQGLREIRRRQSDLRDEIRRRVEGGPEPPPAPKKSSQEPQE